MLFNPKYRKAESPDALRTRIRSLIDIGFRIVGNIDGRKVDDYSIRDLTANWCFLRGDKAIIFEASLRTLLATPVPVERPPFAFKFE